MTIFTSQLSELSLSCTIYLVKLLTITRRRDGKPYFLPVCTGMSGANIEERLGCPADTEGAVTSPLREAESGIHDLASSKARSASGKFTLPRVCLTTSPKEYH